MNGIMSALTHHAATRRLRQLDTAYRPGPATPEPDRLVRAIGLALLHLLACNHEHERVERDEINRLRAWNHQLRTENRAFYDAALTAHLEQQTATGECIPLGPTLAYLSDPVTGAKVVVPVSPTTAGGSAA